MCSANGTKFHGQKVQKKLWVPKSRVGTCEVALPIQNENTVDSTLVSHIVKRIKQIQFSFSFFKYFAYDSHNIVIT